ncbi:MAG: sigma-54-dependent Fis family transcriptional regulator [Alphaproteobacteria bacterium]|nr:sigma-54-dependent Fis family transcriptional regulator [Alphaproteobacteria bacterium]
MQNYPSYPQTPQLFSGQDKCVNECISRIESIKIRIVGNPLISEIEKHEFINDLDVLRATYLHLNTMQLSSTRSIKSQENANRVDIMSVALEIEGILGQNTEIIENLKKISKIAGSKLTVLLEGETGAGKELFARIVHHNSKREKLVTVNCGAFASGLLESEMFGHVKGAFTGAIADRKGKFEEANGGTIFLDEIGEMEPQAQVTLLRVLDTGEIQRVGSDKTFQVDVRIIAATNKTLEDMVKEGRFREDLYYRLNVCHLKIPPLRDRRDEIELLFEYFVKKAVAENRLEIPVLNEQVRKFLFEEYDFPGNIRELRNIALYITHIYSKKPIAISDLPQNYKLIISENNIDNHKTKRNIAKDKAEKDFLTTALTKHKGDIKKVCKEISLSRSRVYQMIKKHSLSPKEFK